MSNIWTAPKPLKTATRLSFALILASSPLFTTVLPAQADLASTSGSTGTGTIVNAGGRNGTSPSKGYSNRFFVTRGGDCNGKKKTYVTRINYYQNKRNPRQSPQALCQEPYTPKDVVCGTSITGTMQGPALNPTESSKTSTLPRRTTTFTRWLKKAVGSTNSVAKPAQLVNSGQALFTNCPQKLEEEPTAYTLGGLGKYTFQLTGNVINCKADVINTVLWDGKVRNHQINWPAYLKGGKSAITTCAAQSAEHPLTGYTTTSNAVVAKYCIVSKAPNSKGKVATKVLVGRGADSTPPALKNALNSLKGTAGERVSYGGSWITFDKSVCKTDKIITTSTTTRTGSTSVRTSVSTPPPITREIENEIPQVQCVGKPQPRYVIRDKKTGKERILTSTEIKLFRDAEVVKVQYPNASLNIELPPNSEGLEIVPGSEKYSFTYLGGTPKRPGGTASNEHFTTSGPIDYQNQWYTNPNTSTTHPSKWETRFWKAGIVGQPWRGRATWTLTYKYTPFVLIEHPAVYSTVYTTTTSTSSSGQVTSTTTSHTVLVSEAWTEKKTLPPVFETVNCNSEPTRINVVQARIGVGVNPK